MAKLHKNEKKVKRKVEMWVARDESFRVLNLFTHKPEKNVVWGELLLINTYKII